MNAPATTSWLAVPVLLGVLAVGVYLSAVLDGWLTAAVAGTPGRVAAVITGPVRRGAELLRRPQTGTEAPDATLHVLAPGLYGALAVLVATTVPLAAGFAVADVRTGIVVVGAAEALTFVAVYLHGWGPNSLLALIGGYRFVAFGLSFVLLSMFVLIGAALPAESLAVGEIVESQRSLWNVVRQPLGLPLFLVVILGVSLRPPLAAADGTDLAGGTAAESSGPQLLAWELAKRLMLVAYALVAASVFVGGYLGPLLPGPVWLGVKTVAILAVVQAIGHLVGRVPTPRFVSVAWTVLLPLSFFGLAAAGVQAL